MLEGVAVDDILMIVLSPVHSIDPMGHSSGVMFEHVLHYSGFSGSFFEHNSQDQVPLNSTSSCPIDVG